MMRQRSIEIYAPAQLCSIVGAYYRFEMEPIDKCLRRVGVFSAYPKYIPGTWSDDLEVFIALVYLAPTSPVWVSFSTWLLTKTVTKSVVSTQEKNYNGAL